MLNSQLSLRRLDLSRAHCLRQLTFAVGQTASGPLPMGSASSSMIISHSDRMQCHGCGGQWLAPLLTGPWTCQRCTLRNEPCAAYCAACDLAPRSNTANVSRLPCSCPLCGGEFVERVNTRVCDAHTRARGAQFSPPVASVANALPLSGEDVSATVSCQPDEISGGRLEEAPSRTSICTPGTESTDGISAFDIEKRLGQGAHGCAMLVRRKRDGQKLVAKQIIVEGLSDEDRIAAMREVDVMKTLHHPNIIEMHTSFIDQHLFIIMEWAPGGDLAEYLKQARQQGPLSQLRVSSIASGVLAGLEHVHSRRLLHRDIKPANVLFSAEGSIKLADFGVSRVMSHTLSQARTVVGTPNYLSPELLEEHGYSFPSDIWAAGVLIYECLAYRHPFRGQNLPALVFDIMQGCPKPLPACYSAEMQYLVSSMLQRIPEQRPGACECLMLLARVEDPRAPAHIRRSFEGRRMFQNLISRMPAVSCEGRFPLEIRTPR